MTLWYLARATGAVTLILLTLTVALGVANRQRWVPPRTPRFVVEHLHRTTSLLVLVLLGVHIAANVVDGYVQIRLVDAVVPFVSSYQPFWLGLGTLAFDLLLALVATSLLRAHIGVRAWRAIHWAAYACWPVALVHGLGIGTDTGTTGWMTWLSIACVGVVGLALWARLTREPRPLAGGPVLARPARRTAPADAVLPRSPAVRSAGRVPDAAPARPRPIRPAGTGVDRPRAAVGVRRTTTSLLRDHDPHHDRRTLL